MYSIVVYSLILCRRYCTVTSAFAWWTRAFTLYFRGVCVFGNETKSKSYIHIDVGGGLVPAWTCIHNKTNLIFF